LLTIESHPGCLEVSQMSLHAHSAWFETVQDARAGDRRRLHLQVELSTSASGAPAATVRNLSSTGLLIETATPLAVGETIEVDLPRAGNRSAEVVWSSDQLYGCRFTQVITEGAISAALLRGQPVAPAVARELESSLEQQGYRPDATKAESQVLSRRAKFLVVSVLALASWTPFGAAAAFVTR
jgi:hypothetical protein